MLTRLLTLVPLLFAILDGRLLAESSVWKITGAQTSIYLAGSFHILKASDYPLPPEFEEAYENSQKIYFETNLDELKDPVVIARIVKLSLYPDGSSLKDHLSAETYEKLKAQCESAGVNIASVEHYRPWIITIMISLNPAKKDGYDQTQGVDQYYFNLAKEDGKPVVGLETTEESIQLLSSLGDQLDEELISEALHSASESNESVDKMKDAWRSGDETGLQTMVADQVKGYPKIYKLLFLDRNANWSKTMESALSQPGISMFVVGAGHLVGADGLLAMFRNKGYQVEKLNISLAAPEPPADLNAHR